MFTDDCQHYLNKILTMIHSGASQLEKGTIVLSWLRSIVQDDMTRKQFVILSLSTAVREICKTHSLEYECEAVADPKKFEKLLALRQRELDIIDKTYANLDILKKECKSLEAKCRGTLSNTPH